MRTFFQSILGSCLGVLLAMLVVFLILAGIGSSFLSTGKEAPDVKANSVIRLTLKENLPELTNNVGRAGIESIMDQKKMLSIHDYADLIVRAAKDKNIKGIYFEPKNMALSQTKREVLEDALKTFRDSGKFIYAYSEFYTGPAYHLATLADEVAIFPNGGIDLRGTAAIIPHFKSLSDKIGVNFETYFAGKFKSATEPFRLDHMSDANKLQTHSYLQSLYGEMLKDIIQNRSIDSLALENIINTYASRNAKTAKENGLVDKIVYEDEMLQHIKDQLGLKKDEDINFVSLGDYYKSEPLKNNLSKKDKIAVVYAEGNIHDGPEQSGSISGDQYVKVLREIRQDEDVKAVVLRIDSPGGSAMASEKIWRELKLIQEKGIPVLASMGTYAASGGYYMASGAQYIEAEPTTITGSIGVFILLPKIDELLNDKMGVNVDTVRTNRYSASFTPFFASSPGEQQILQSEVDQIYEIFLERVAEARNMSRDAVNEVAQGRVWTGKQALEKGLVDQMGNLSSTIEKAAEMANIEEYRTVAYPQIKDPFYQLIDELTGEKFNAKMKFLRSDPADLLHSKIKKELKIWSQPQARMPMDIIYN